MIVSITEEILLFCVIGKVFARMERLQAPANSVYECGSIAKRSTLSRIFPFKLKTKQPIYDVFIYLIKVFDQLKERGVFALLKKIRYLQKLMSLITPFHD